MKKIRTLYERDTANPKIVTDRLVPGGEVVFTDAATPTWKLDGMATRIIVTNDITGGIRGFFKRREVKNGKPVPPGFEEVDRHDGNVYGWVPVGDGPEDVWLRAAHLNTDSEEEGTYEAVGPHFQGNPHGFDKDHLRRHGTDTPPWAGVSDCAELREILASCKYEGIVWFVNGEPAFKIKRRDFGLPWPVKE